MKRPSKAGGKPVNARRRKAVMLKRRIASKATPAHGPSAANLHERVDALTRELKEAREQQTATSEVLQVISSSPGELQPVFETMLANATRLCEANFGFLHLYENGLFRVGAMHNAPSAFVRAFNREPLVVVTLGPHPRAVDQSTRAASPECAAGCTGLNWNAAAADL